ncbi:MAG: 2-C-methyl-D-erythritol 4-phosphate cytidylyltransferase [Phycisphaerales bacterium]|jgi:2-C-methyl-D-erythritol 4-phosphate cytidylyltransferase|nr:2-C-methyl-D-erythritol 4-phosphate cytidylyltransferase [Phycisphaerales bacterium]
MKLCVIIPAAGASTRYNAGGEFARSKLDEDLGGRPVLHRSVDLFAKLEMEGVDIASIIVAGPHDEQAFSAFSARHGDTLRMLGCTLVRGGVTHRYETVAAALSHVPNDATHVAIHDAARPCAPSDMIERVLDASQRHDAVVPALPVGDTLKHAPREVADDEDDDPVAAILGASAVRPALRAVDRTLDRANIFAVQTPQVFRRELVDRSYGRLAGALSSGGAGVVLPTDDAEVVERFLADAPDAGPVLLVAGDARNIKITTPADLAIARAVLGAKPPQDRPAHKRF